MAGLRQDLLFALRYLARRRTFTATAVLTLAVGIGAMTAIWSVVESVVLRPLPVAEPERVVFVFERSKELESNVSAGNYLDLRVATASFSALAALQRASLNLAGGESPQRVLAGYTTHELFTIFGARPVVGRVFTADEETPGRDDVVVLGHGLWVRGFGADRQVVGRFLRLSGRPCQIIGVLGDGFDPTLSGEQLWLPLAFTAAERAQHDEHRLTVVGRLAAGVSRERAQARLGAAMARLAARYPEANGGRGVIVRPLPDVLIGDYRQRLLLLVGAVTFVLLIACGNVVNLLLAQGAMRAKEIAVRIAVGAGRRRIIRQMLTESVVLALLAAAAGTALAKLGTGFLLASAPAGIPRLAETSIDAGVLAFTVVVALASSVVFGLGPALRATRRDRQLLRTGERGMGPARDRLRNGLVLAEVAVSLTLLICAGLLIRGARRLQTVALGFDPEGVVAAQVALPEIGYRDSERLQGAFRQMLYHLERAPGVANAAVVSRAPLGPHASSNALLPAGRPPRPENMIGAALRIVSPGYFATMKIPLQGGRLFDRRDSASGQPVMLVSRELARRAWKGEDAVGKQVACCDATPDVPRWRTVVGVVGDVRSDGPAVPVTPEFYLPLDQMPAMAVDWLQRSMTLVVRGPRPALAGGAIRRAVAEVDPTAPVFGIAKLSESLRASTAENRFQTSLLTVLGALGLLLAMLGVYSVIAYFVSLRGYEIAVRTALGARPRDIVWLLTWQGIRPILAGIAVGCGAAVAATRLLADSLQGVSATDPLTFAAAVLLLLSMGLAATLIPAGRATRVQPDRSLRSA